MTEQEPAVAADQAARLAALRGRKVDAMPSSSSPASPGAPQKKRTRSGPAPSRILAAAASVSAGIGLVAVMAGAQQEVVQINPTPITVQPATIIVEVQSGSDVDASDIQVRVVEAATPAEQSSPAAMVASQSEGS